MGSNGDYCAYTKAVEHIGDRWSLLIIRELVLLGSRGFNALASGLPGGISRSVLSDRLRKLEELGLVARDPRAPSRTAGYVATPAGEQLRPVMHALVGWAERWVPEDPVVAERDPDIVIWWLTNRIDPDELPGRQVVIDLDIRGPRTKHAWLVLEPARGPSLCLEDPCLDGDRYVYVEADVAGIFPIARGQRDWADAIADGSVKLFGDPGLVRALPGWFKGADAGPRSQPVRRRNRAPPRPSPDRRAAPTA